MKKNFISYALIISMVFTTIPSRNLCNDSSVFAYYLIDGDLNGDSNVTVSDVVTLRKIINSGDYVAIGDLSNDGNLDSADVLLLRKIIMDGGYIDYTSIPKVVDGVYQISKTSEMLWAAQNPDKDYELVNDINLTNQPEWIPIGTESSPFTGTFDGNNHTITVDIDYTATDSGVYSVGLFGFVSGSISNLNVDGDISTTIYSGYVGAIASNLVGGSIINCTNDASITATSSNNVLHVGGIAGGTWDSADGYSYIDSSVNNGNIYVNATTTTSSDTHLGNGTTGSVGGILGFVSVGSGAEIGRTINNGAITVDNGKDNIGGIVGQTSTNNDNTFCNITYCANKGDITVYNTKGERAAGIIGYTKGGKIEYCYNIANIIEYTDNGSTVARTGYGNYFGIFGYANLAGSNTLSVIYCYNASSNPMEAEICVIRNPSKGTFKNFYMSGREEYETQLNSNATAGTAGTAFSSASDLYNKLCQTTEGASAYRSNGNGYPVLYFEKDSYTESVSLNLSGLPAYVDGTVSSNIYNSGPGMANDQKGATSEDAKMVVVSSTNSTSFERYISKLITHNFDIIQRTTIEDNIHYSLNYNGTYYYAYYTANKKEARFILDPATNIPVTKLNSNEAGNSGTGFYMYSLDYTKGESTTSVTDYWRIDCGTMFIIKFSDNSIFWIDNGHERQSSDSAMEAQLDFLREITGTSANEKIKVRSLFISHPHGDHVYGMHKFIEKYHDYMELDSVIFNIPAYGVIGGYDAGTFKMKDTINTYFPNVDHVSLHTGQTFTMQDVRFETLCTHEDWVSSDGLTTLGSDMNTASTILKVTIDGKTFMLLGDLTKGNQMEAIYTSETLKSDVVQATHHGYNRVQTLYAAIGATLGICPNSEENAGLNSGNAQKQQDIYDAGANKILYAGDYTQKIIVENGEFVISQIDNYLTKLNLSFNTPSASVNEVSGQNASVATLSSVTSRTKASSKIIARSVIGSAVTAKHSSSNASRKENAYCAFDGSTSTKWCTETIPAYVDWKMSESVKLSHYVLYTANDTANNSGRNPVKWILKGSNDGVNWTTLDAVSNGSLPASNYEGTAFTIKNPGSYQYYSMQFFELGSGSIMQLSEISLYQ